MTTQIHEADTDRPVAPTPKTTLPRLARGPYRVEIRCQLDWLSALHVGTGERLSVTTDAPVLRDGRGRPYLPGSSVRGVVRSWCEEQHRNLALAKDIIPHLFGATTEAASDAEKAGTAEPFDRQGRLTVLDVSLPAARVELRDHVRIDPQLGAGAKGGKFDQEVTWSAASELQLIYEGESSSDPELQLLAGVVRALERGELAFGGKTGWGLGAVRARDTEWHVSNRGDPAGLAAYVAGRLGLAGPAPPVGRPVADAESPSATPAAHLLWLSLGLQFDGPMLVAAPYRGDDGCASHERSSADAAYHTDLDGRPFLPGSSLRGAMQAHARFIAATLGRTDLADVLFGQIKGMVEKQRGGEKQKKGSEKQKKAHENAKQGKKSLLRVGDGVLRGEPRTVWMDHVAVDRITGFASDGKLFNSVALASPLFDVTLQLRWSEEDQQKAAVGLLLFTLRDMAAGMLWVGSRTTRGYGHLRTISLAPVRADGEVVGGRDAPVLDVAKLDSAPLLKAAIDAWTQSHPAAAPQGASGRV